MHRPMNYLNSFIQPVRATSNYETLTDNIFSNIFDPEAVSGNHLATASNHLPQFVILYGIFSNFSSSSKKNIYEGERTKFDQKTLFLTILQ